ncbi:MAG: tetratricopeptide repeat protein [Candidatus Omnitrophota bacterium]|nr:MAG: tetratricopeptide repeat protein [Candidatus Omnitrophota bacterium]
MIPRRKSFIHVVVIAIVGFAVYANSLKGEFIWDDEGLVKNNIYIKSFSHLPDIFTEPLGVGNQERDSFDYPRFWRPLQAFTYMIDYQLWELNVVGYHLSNILLHIGVALALYWLTGLLFKNQLLSLCASLLFVVHPIHTEAVSYISGRADLLAALFMVLCLIFYIKNLSTRNVFFYIFMILAYILALLSKELSLVLPILLLLFHFTFRKKFALKQFIPIVSIALLFIVLRLAFLKTFLPGGNQATLPQRIPGFFVALTNYLKLLLAPFPLHMEYGNNIFAFTDIRVIIGVGLSLSLLFCAYKFRKNTLIFFSILWFFIMLLPQSNLYPAGAYMAEHWLYSASIGFFLVVGNSLISCRIKKFQLSTAILTIILVGVYGALTIKQNTYWRNPLGFYERTAQYASGSYRVHYNLGNIYESMARYEEAIASYRKAINLEPDYPKPYYNLGIVYQGLGNTEEAIILYEEAIAMNPNYIEAYNNLGNAYRTIGRAETAIAIYKKALEADPHNAYAYINLGSIYNNMGRVKAAVILYKRAIELDPQLSESYNNLGAIYGSKGKYQDAIVLLKKAIELRPDVTESYSNLGNAYKNISRYQDAITAYKRAIELNTDDPELYYTLGVLYAYVSNYQGAITAYKEAVHLKPDYAQAHNNLAVVYYATRQYTLAVEHCKRAIELGHQVRPQFLQLLDLHRKK